MKHVYAIEISKTQMGVPNAPSDGRWEIDTLYSTKEQAQKVLDRWFPSEWEHYRIKKWSVK